MSTSAFHQEPFRFNTALISMYRLGQNFSPAKAPWVIFRVEHGEIQAFHELRREWRPCDAIPCEWVMGDWVEVIA